MAGIILVSKGFVIKLRLLLEGPVFQDRGDACGSLGYRQVFHIGARKKITVTKLVGVRIAVTGINNLIFAQRRPLYRTRISLGVRDGSLIAYKNRLVLDCRISNWRV